MEPRDEIAATWEHDGKLGITFMTDANESGPVRPRLATPARAPERSGYLLASSMFSLQKVRRSVCSQVLKSVDQDVCGNPQLEAGLVLVAIQGEYIVGVRTDHAITPFIAERTARARSSRLLRVEVPYRSVHFLTCVCVLQVPFQEALNRLKAAGRPLTLTFSQPGEHMHAVPPQLDIIQGGF